MSVQEQLRELFLVDQQVRGLRSRVDAAARRLAVQQTRLGQYQRQFAEVGTQLKQARASAAHLEADAANVEGRIEKIRQTMAGVRNNKEYSALLVEVNTLKLDKAKIEDQALEHLGRVDELNGQAEEIGAKVAEQTRIVDLAQKEVDEGQGEIAEQLGALTRQREAAAEPIDPQALAMYQKLAKDYEGEALAEVEEQDRRRREYTCGACFMSLPIQVVNAALTATDKPVACSNCQRILFVSAELKDALVPK